MIGAGILDGDVVVVRSQSDAREGDIVAAQLRRPGRGRGHRQAVPPRERQGRADRREPRLRPRSRSSTGACSARWSRSCAACSERRRRPLSPPRAAARGDDTELPDATEAALRDASADDVPSAPASVETHFLLAIQPRHDVRAVVRDQQRDLDRACGSALAMRASTVGALAGERRDGDRVGVPAFAAGPVPSRRPGPTCSAATTSGISAAPISPRTSRTASICSSRSRTEASATCRIRSARATSSSVDLNASTRSWGSLRTNPTVSDTVTARPPGSTQPARQRVERRERLVGHERVRAGQGVQQRGLPGVRVAGQRDLRDARSARAALA